MLHVYIAVAFAVFLFLGSLPGGRIPDSARAIARPLAGIMAFLMCLIGFDEYSGVFPILVSIGIVMLIVGDVFLLTPGGGAWAGRLFSLLGSLVFIVSFGKYLPAPWWWLVVISIAAGAAVLQFRWVARSVVSRIGHASQAGAFSAGIAVITVMWGHTAAWGAETAFLAILIIYAAACGYRSLSPAA